MLLHLSTLLHRSLDEEAHEVSLRQELAFVDDYLEIQRGRFGESISCADRRRARGAGRTLAGVCIVALFENAMEHGKADDNRTTIALSARRADDKLRLTLEDDGPGVRDGAMIREGIGLRNSRARLVGCVNSICIK